MSDMSDSTIEEKGVGSGFTLLEVLVAVSIIAIVFVSVFRVHFQTLSMSQRIRFDSLASLLLQDKLAEYETKPLEELSGDSGDFGEKFPGYQWQVVVSDVESELLEETAENLKKIEITVTHNDGESLRISAYRYIQE